MVGKGTSDRDDPETELTKHSERGQTSLLLEQPSEHKMQACLSAKCLSGGKLLQVFLLVLLGTHREFLASGVFLKLFFY